jgi:molybdate transport system substrate-binding protein
VGSLVEQGRAELGFQQLSELMNLRGVEVLGPLPPAIQTLTIFSGGVCAASAQPAAARALLQFVASPATAGLKHAHGMAPPR